MTEHDRGAYTPQPDAPLQFDARGPRRRKPMPMTLIGSGAVLVVLLGALALHARHDGKTGGDPVRPVGAPIAEVKGPAPATAQPKEAGGAVDVFGGVAQNTAQNTAHSPTPTLAKTPTFAPPPETPKPRAQLKVQTAEETTATKTAPLATTNATAPVALAPVALAKAKTAPAAPPAQAYHAPTLASATAPKPAAGVVVAKVAAAPATRPAALTTTTPATTVLASTPKTAASVFGGSVVQIGAFSSMGLSEKGWTDVSSAMTGEMSGKMKRVEAVEKDGKTFYRTSVAGFSSRSAAEAFCRSLTAKGHVCFAKG